MSVVPGSGGRIPGRPSSKRLTSRNNFDDTPDSIKKRIETYNAKTLPIVEKYAGKVKKINAERPKEEIFEDIKKIFDGF